LKYAIPAPECGLQLGFVPDVALVHTALELVVTSAQLVGTKVVPSKLSLTTTCAEQKNTFNNATTASNCFFINFNL
jgi:hypothetical protein